MPTAPPKPTRLCLVIDQGTHATRAMIIDDTGQTLATHFQDISLNRIDQHRVEQDPIEILDSIRSVIKQTVTDQPIDCAALATQRSTIVAWDNTKPLAPALSWQDTRAQEYLQHLNSTLITQTTGLVASPHYAASKIRWLLEHHTCQNPAVRAAQQHGQLHIASLASYLLHHLTDNTHPRIDHTNAARTLLFNIHTRDWDPQLLNAFNIPQNILPTCHPAQHHYGQLQPTNTPITCVCGDQSAALHATGTPRPDTAYINLGTGAFILVPTGEKPIQIDGLLCTLANSTDTNTTYCIEGTVNGAGAALAWAQNKWNLPDPAQHLTQWLQQPTTPPIFLNTIGGLGSPFWTQGPTPNLVTIEGKTLTTPPDPATTATAIVESILFLINANLTLIRQTQTSIIRIQISGGLANTDPLCQRLADLTHLPVTRPQQTEATAKGAAYLALNTPTTWTPPTHTDTFHPNSNPLLQTRYHHFIDLIQQP